MLLPDGMKEVETGGLTVVVGRPAHELSRHGNNAKASTILASDISIRTSGLAGWSSHRGMQVSISAYLEHISCTCSERVARCVHIRNDLP